jgi:hypothetical protein
MPGQRKREVGGGEDNLKWIETARRCPRPTGSSGRDSPHSYFWGLMTAQDCVGKVEEILIQLFIFQYELSVTSLLTRHNVFQSPGLPFSSVYVKTFLNPLRWVKGFKNFV